MPRAQPPAARVHAARAAQPHRAGTGTPVRLPRAAEMLRIERRGLSAAADSHRAPAPAKAQKARAVRLTNTFLAIKPRFHP